ncbi:hypothetical protein LEP1GSC097_2801 [Leptospira interrogans serovar Grippotyphosa str. UI 08368]|nr:hypothetical protein LEP1GSC097_2801 [Leptospira interrogans serovar Grippotyphosa str. UI 08368]
MEFIESENVISSVNNVYLNGVRIAALNEAGAPKAALSTNP